MKNSLSVCSSLIVLLGFSLLASFPSAAALASKKKITYTTIVVTDMHCSTCAKKIAAKLYVLRGVLEVRADVKKNIAYVVPQKNKSVSSRKMWEAVESAGFKVVKMTGPGGNYTSKPNK